MFNVEISEFHWYGTILSHKFRETTFSLIILWIDFTEYFSSERKSLVLLHTEPWDLKKITYVKPFYSMYACEKVDFTEFFWKSECGRNKFFSPEKISKTNLQQGNIFILVKWVDSWFDEK